MNYYYKRRLKSWIATGFGCRAMATTTRHATGAILIGMAVVCLFCSVEAASAFYNPSTGRWLSRDPIAEKGGLNLYWLLANDPVNFVDLHGLKEYVGTAYQDADITGHAMVEIFGQTYGFGPKESDANPLWTVGTTEGWDGIPDPPRWEDRLFVKKSSRTCRQYVQAIIVGCCLNNEGAHMNGQ